MTHYLVMGKTGAGKSTLVKAMIPYFERVVVLDRHREYNDLETVYGFDALADRISRNPRHAYRIAFRSDNDAEWIAAIALLYFTQRTLSRSGEAQTLLLVVEEIGLLSSPHKVPKAIGYCWNYGRHYGITAVGVCRQDTETHSVLRLNSTRVFFRCSELTAKVSAGLKKGDVEEIAHLPLLNWEDGERIPQAGKHYVTDPDSGDILGRLQGRSRLKIIV